MGKPVCSIAEMAPVMVSFFAEIPDPRVERTRRHDLVEIIVIAILATICGADHWEEMEQFAREREDLLRSVVELKHGIPSFHTFRRVFAAMEVDAFGRAFIGWTKALCETTEGKLIAVDGKTLRGSFTAKARQDPRHIVSAWVGENRVVLGQVSTEEKSNEITAIPRLLELLDIKGATITIDAMGCQRKIVETIIERGGEYVIAVKDNQPTLRIEVEGAFATAEISEEKLEASAVHETLGKAHGRIERRKVTALSIEDRLTVSDAWAGLRSIVRVESERTVGAATSHETRYYISSLAPDGAHLGRAIREHWGIENQQHWTLDMAFNEDRARTRKKNGPDNMALLRRIALNFLKQDTSSKRASIRGKRLRAGWSDKYLGEVLRAIVGQ